MIQKGSTLILIPCEEGWGRGSGPGESQSGPVNRNRCKQAHRRITVNILLTIQILYLLQILYLYLYLQVILFAILASLHCNQVQMQTGTYVNISVKIYIFISPVQQNLQIFCRVLEYWEMKLQILAPNNALSEKEAVNTSPIFFFFILFFHISALIYSLFWWRDLCHFGGQN